MQIRRSERNYRFQTREATQVMARAIEDRMQRYHQDLEDRMKIELEQQLSKFKEIEVGAMRVEERQRYSLEIAKLKGDYESRLVEQRERMTRTNEDMWKKLEVREREIEKSNVEFRQRVLEESNRSIVSERNSRSEAELALKAMTMERDSYQRRLDDARAEIADLHGFRDRYTAKMQETMAQYKVDLYKEQAQVIQAAEVERAKIETEKLLLEEKTRAVEQMMAKVRETQQETEALRANLKETKYHLDEVLKERDDALHEVRELKLQSLMGPKEDAQKELLKVKKSEQRWQRQCSELVTKLDQEMNRADELQRKYDDEVLRNKELMREVSDLKIALHHRTGGNFCIGCVALTVPGLNIDPQHFGDSLKSYGVPRRIPSIHQSLAVPATTAYGSSPSRSIPVTSPPRGTYNPNPARSAPLSNDPGAQPHIKPDHTLPPGSSSVSRRPGGAGGLAGLDPAEYERIINDPHAEARRYDLSHWGWQEPEHPVTFVYGAESTPRMPHQRSGPMGEEDLQVPRQQTRVTDESRFRRTLSEALPPVEGLGTGFVDDVLKSFSSDSQPQAEEPRKSPPSKPNASKTPNAATIGRSQLPVPVPTSSASSSPKTQRRQISSKASQGLPLGKSDDTHKSAESTPPAGRKLAVTAAQPSSHTQPSAAFHRQGALKESPTTSLEDEASRSAAARNYKQPARSVPPSDDDVLGSDHRRQSSRSPPAASGGSGKSTLSRPQPPPDDATSSGTSSGLSGHSSARKADRDSSLDEEKETDEAQRRREQLEEERRRDEERKARERAELERIRKEREQMERLFEEQEERRRREDEERQERERIEAARRAEEEEKERARKEEEERKRREEDEKMRKIEELENDPTMQKYMNIVKERKEREAQEKAAASGEARANMLGLDNSHSSRQSSFNFNAGDTADEIRTRVIPVAVGIWNECIAATGILYYSVSNIKNARVEFRELFEEEPFDYYQNEHSGINQVYGLVSEESLNVQPCGHAEASRTGRVLVFPNSNQHRVPPFELEDPTKPGHRKMLVFFLVHPGTRVPSSLNVPPQQWEWGLEELQKIIPAHVPTDCLDGMLSRLGLRKDTEDKEITKKVMEERKVADPGRYQVKGVQVPVTQTIMEFYKDRPDFRYHQHHPKTLREQHYLACLSAVLNKPRWWEKLQDEAITLRWASELQLAKDEEDFLFAELRYIHDHKLKRDTAGNVLFSPLTALGTYVSDTVVDAGLVEELSRDLSLAEEEALKSQRWHPGSENITLDIFHPSNYCVVYGKTRISETPNALFGDKILHFPSQTFPIPPGRKFPDYLHWVDVSPSFQWLPSDFEVADDGKVTIRSYINNLHPRRHKAAYHTIAQVYGKLIPMFEMALGTLGRDSPYRIAYNKSMIPSVGVLTHKWGNELEALSSREERVSFVRTIPIETPDDQIDWDAQEFNDADQLIEFLYDHGYGSRETHLVQAEIPGFPAFDSYLEKVKSLLEDTVMPLQGRQLQVIVKAASINLSPENPRYPGGGWHLEGTDNECIAATGILYYSVSNIKDARVEFREVFEENFDYNQDEHSGINQ
ncbi:hypothetical protein HDU96_003110, partial [Phlyctochytrium bullatum]